MRLYQNPYILKIALATDRCNEGYFVKKVALTFRVLRKLFRSSSLPIACIMGLSYSSTRITTRCASLRQARSICWGFFIIKASKRATSNFNNLKEINKIPLKRKIKPLKHSEHNIKQFIPKS